jgi:hypothetical protein
MQCFTNYYENIDSITNTNFKKKAKANDKCDQIKLTDQNYLTVLTNLTNNRILGQYKFGGNSNYKTIIICRTLCFIVGALVEAYTYKLDPNNSMGLGWGLFAAIVLF